MTVELADIKSATDELGRGFEEFKATNDARLKQIEKNGVADPVTVEKLAKIEASLAAFEGANQKLTLAEQAAKKASDDAADLKSRQDRVETLVNRLGGGAIAPTPADRKSKVNSWARAVIGANLRGIPNLSADERKAIDDAAADFKSMSVANDTTGGYLAPSEFVTDILKGVTEFSPFRSLARVRSTGAKSIQQPRRTGQFAARWVGEQETRSETTGLAYGMIEISTHEMYALIDISEQNLEDSAFDLESEIRTEAVEQFGLAEGAAFVTGVGTGKPQGFLNASGVETTNSTAATAVAADGLIALYHAIKTAYARKATWVLNRKTLGSVRKLKDGTSGQYLWQPGLALNVPNTILGSPYVEMPDMPDEASGAKPVAFGDFSRAYTVVDRIGMTMLRDPYTQATGGNIRFIFRARVGGQVVLPEAIRAMVCST